VTDIGFIGLGNMGQWMSQRLVSAGHQVYGYDVSDAAVEAFVLAGGTAARSVRDAASTVELVITMLPDTPQVLDVMEPDNDSGLLGSVRPGTVVVDMSTIAPAASRRLARSAASRKLDFLDAPVSRGQDAAKTGELLILAGGDADVFARIEATFACMGSTVLHVGPNGSGAVAKLVNNLIVGAVVCATAEGLVYGVKAGVEANALMQVLMEASGRTFVLEKFFPAALAGDFEPGFFVDLMHKDLGLALSDAAAQPVPLVMAAAAKDLFSRCQAAGLGRQDMTAILHHLADAADVQVRVPSTGSDPSPCST